MTEYGPKEASAIDVTIYVTVLAKSNGASIIITTDLLETYLVQFTLVGRILKGSGRFIVELVRPLDGLPRLNPREVRELCQVINEAVAKFVDGKYDVSNVTPAKLLLEGVQDLPKRLLRLAP